MERKKHLANKQSLLQSMLPDLGADLLNRAKSAVTAQIGVEISAGDLQTMHKLKNTTSHLDNDQCNIPSATQISVVANKLMLLRCR